MSNAATCPRSSARALLTTCLTAAILGLLGCSADTVGIFEAGPAPNLLIAVESGANQVVKAGAEFPQPIRVRATVNGLPFTKNLGFTYSDASPPASTMGGTPNANGQVAYTRTVGATPGAFTVTVYHNHCTEGQDFGGGCTNNKAVRVGTIIVNGQIVP